MPQLNLDCEGPLTLNDNAFELCAHFIPQGDKLFALVSKYDDYLADIEKRPGYKAGDTLKLVLPFLKAFDVTNRLMKEFSQKTLKLVPKALAFLRFAAKVWPTYIISTSYRPYLEALSAVSGFPLENVFCTEVDLDKVHLSREEIKLLQELARELATLPMIDWPENAKALSDLPPESQKVILRLDQIFWQIIPETAAGRFLEEVNPIGGPEKARAVSESLERTGLTAEDVLYVGDSITDVEAFSLVRENQGGSVSFNGNRYALRAAEFFALAPQAASLACLAVIFDQGGREGLLKEARAQSLHPCKRLEGELASYAVDFAFGLVADFDFEELVARSVSLRKKVRGAAVGALG